MVAPFVSVIGCGALGSLLIARLAGLKIRMKIIDRDFVDEQNTGIFFSKADIGEPKALVMKNYIERKRGAAKTWPVTDDLNSKNIASFLKNSCLVIDCTDNMRTRYLLNDFCIRKGVPFIYNGVIGSEGMSAVFSVDGRPCFRCLFPKIPRPGILETCETRGVSPVAAETVAGYAFRQAAEITRGGKADEGKLFYFDLKSKRSFISKIRPDKKCMACINSDFEFLNGGHYQKIMELCGRNSWHISPPEKISLNLSSIRDNFGSGYRVKLIKDVLLHIEFSGKKISVFSDGRAIASAMTENEAKSIYSRVVGD